MQLNKQFIFGCCLLLTQVTFAHGPRPPSMIGAPIPPVTGTLNNNPVDLSGSANAIVKNEAMAIALGKALFWDMNVGSDGMACASCHFHAGADSRTKNQLNPGNKGNVSTSTTFETTLAGLGGPNYNLVRSDFPFFKLADSFNLNSAELFRSDDVASSSGTFSGELSSVPRVGESNDDCSRSADTTFHVGGVGTRRVEPRNTPTVINAVFNHRNFWDGRANNVFNGSSPWGDRDPNAGVWVKINGRTAQKQKLHLVNSSLASQAVAPPLSDTEMGCRSKKLADVGRKLLMRKPLEKQNVHHQDSVLGAMSFSTAGNLQPGLNTTYTAMIQQAFNSKFWSFRRRQFGGPTGELPYTQMEANFALFFGIAIQMYESTLVSDQAPIDTVARNPLDFLPREEAFFPVEAEIGTAAYNGLKHFINFHCNLCHVGPALTTNAVYTNAKMFEDDPNAFGLNDIANVIALNYNVVGYDTFRISSGLHDTGFMNTSVGDPAWDPGVNSTDDFGNPLSFAEQYVQSLAGNAGAVVDQDVLNVRSCDFFSLFALNLGINRPDHFTSLDDIIPDPHSTTNCFQPNALSYFIPSQTEAAAELANPNTLKLAQVNSAAFKIPTLRNVELTGPYMHNGSMATLDEVIEFYSRGGNILNDNTHNNIFPAGLLQTSAVARSELLAFLKTLTDERVRNEMAPFDHPELIVPHGHTGNDAAVSAGNPLAAVLAVDETIVVPAVGANGAANPLPEFVDLLAP